MERNGNNQKSIINHIIDYFIIIVFISAVAFIINITLDYKGTSIKRKYGELSSFQLTGLLDNKIYSETDLGSDSSYFLLNFWGTWCPPCIQEHSFLKRLSKYETIHGVNVKDNKERAINFLKTNGNPYGVIISDSNGNLLNSMSIRALPATLLISFDGKVLVEHIGVLDQRVWERKFNPIIEEITYD